MEGLHVAGWTSGSPTPAQLKEFFAQIESGRITKERLQAFLRGEKEDTSVLLADWQEFYRGLFGLEIDLSGLSVPGRKKGFDRLIVVAQGMTPQRLYDKCAEFFPCWKWADEDLDRVVQSERTAKDGTYAVWFREGVEADKDLKNLSANDLEKKLIPGITLEERLLMELKYFKETGGHLDIDSFTLCSGSRYSGGRVPGVCWFPVRRWLRVGWFLPEDSAPHLRSRRAVS